MPLDYSDPALEDATVKIQASYRGYRTRKGLAAQSQSDATETSEETPMFEGTDEENQAAAKIQAGFRGSKVRKELAEDKKQKADQASIDAIDLHDPEVQAASLKIQAGFRGMQGRREAKALAAGGGGGDESADAVAAGAEEVNFEGTDEEHAAAAKIQAGFRGHQVRKDMAGKAEGGEGDGEGEGGAAAAAEGDAAPAAAEGEGDVAAPVAAEGTAEGDAAAPAPAEAEAEAAAAATGEGEGEAWDAAALAKIKATKESHPDNLACKHFDFDYYGSLESDELKKRFLAIVKTGYENQDSNMGCYAMQPSDYDDFKPFFAKVLAGYHKVAEDAVHKNDWSLEGVEGLPEGGKLDLAALGLPELSMRVRVGRNLKDFPLPGAMTKDDRTAMEEKLCKAFDTMQSDPELKGTYNSITPGHANFVDEEAYKQLVADHIMFKDMAADPYLASAGIASDWPFGRGCYVSDDKQFIIWVGEEDHLRIMVMQKGAVLNEVFERLHNALDAVNEIEGLEFAHSEQYGMVTSCPTNLGTGMRASVHIPIPNLTSDGTDAKAKEICKPLGLSVRGTGGEHTPIGADGTCDISPSARFCITEAQIITALYNGLKLLKEEEGKAAA